MLRVPTLDQWPEPANTQQPQNPKITHAPRSGRGPKSATRKTQEAPMPQQKTSANHQNQPKTLRTSPTPVTKRTVSMKYDNREDPQSQETVVT